MFTESDAAEPTSQGCRQFVLHALGDLGSGEVRTVPTPRAGPGQIVLGMDFVSVSYVDALTVGGAYQVVPALPFAPGVNGVGRVVEVGPGADGIAVGDRLAVQTDGGLLADRVVVRAADTARVPDGVAPEIAAASIESWATASYALLRRAVVMPGQTVLVLGAGGGVGAASVNVAASRGARVIAVGSTPDKRAAAVARGAAHVIDPGAGPLASAVRDVAPHGVDLVVDPVGGDLALQAIKLLAPEGRYCVLGFASGDIPRFGANRILIDNHTVVGVDYGAAPRADPAMANIILRSVLDGFAAGDFSADPPLIMSFDDAPEAFRRAASGQHATRTVVSFGDRRTS